MDLLYSLPNKKKRERRKRRKQSCYLVTGLVPGLRCWAPGLPVADNRDRTIALAWAA